MFLKKHVYLSAYTIASGMMDQQILLPIVVSGWRWLIIRLFTARRPARRPSHRNDTWRRVYLAVVLDLFTRKIAGWRPHRLPLDLIRELTTRRTHQTPFQLQQGLIKGVHYSGGG
jgi:transposase InsO family protein